MTEALAQHVAETLNAKLKRVDATPQPSGEPAGAAAEELAEPRMKDSMKLNVDRKTYTYRIQQWRNNVKQRRGEHRIPQGFEPGSLWKEMQFGPRKWQLIDYLPGDGAIRHVVEETGISEIKVTIRILETGSKDQESLVPAPNAVWYYKQLVAAIPELFPGQNQEVELAQQGAAEDKWDPSYEFYFEKDAQTVLRCILPEGSRVYEMDYGGLFLIKAHLSATPALGAIYSINIHVYVKHQLEDAWIIERKKIAVIWLDQERKHECRAELWVKRENEGELLLPVGSHIRFLNKLWQDLIEEVTQSQPDTDELAKPQEIGEAVGQTNVYRQPREETKWYDEWCERYLRGEISRQELNDEWGKWYRELYPDVGQNPDTGPLRSALSKRKQKWNQQAG